MRFFLNQVHDYTFHDTPPHITSFHNQYYFICYSIKSIFNKNSSLTWIRPFNSWSLTFFAILIGNFVLSFWIHKFLYLLFHALDNLSYLEKCAMGLNCTLISNNTRGSNLHVFNSNLHPLVPKLFHIHLCRLHCFFFDFNDIH